MIDRDETGIGPDEIRTLTRLAGLRGDDAHLRALARELESTLRAAGDLDAAAARAGTLGEGPFDPAWPERRQR